jgi:hypothetical protein
MTAPFRPDLYRFDHTDPRAFDSLHPVNLLGAAGAVLWLIAYALIIARSHRDKAYGLPLVAICLNFGWEILASFVFPASDALWLAFYRAWLAGDAVVVWQLLRHGRALQTSPIVRRYFHPLVALTFVLGLVGQYSFVSTYRDRQGIVVAFGINLVMSVLFLPMALARRAHRRGISVGAAWAKLVGTALQAVQCYYLVRWLDPELPNVDFLVFLGAATFLFDAAYAILVSTRLLDRLTG